MEALIGVLGTILGTILGWLLNSMSQKGNLNIYISDWKEKFTHLGRLGIYENSRNKDEAQTFSYSLTVDLYNSSGATKIMRDVKIVFLDDKKSVFDDVPEDAESCREIAKCLHYDEIEPINIPPKSVERFKLRGNIGGERLEALWGINSIVLQYTNEKNKIKTINIENANFLGWFDEHVTEEK